MLMYYNNENRLDSKGNGAVNREPRILVAAWLARALM
jgi:hypothetical protein